MLQRTDINCWYINKNNYDNKPEYKYLKEQNVISLGFDKKVDLREGLDENIDIEDFIDEKCIYKKYLKRFTKIKKGDYFKYIEYHSDDNSINKIEYIGKITGDFNTHYKFDSKLGHTLPIEWVYENRELLSHKAFSDMWEINKDNILKNMKYIYLEEDKKLKEELEFTNNKIYFLNNGLYNKNNIEDCNNIIISINNEKNLNIIKNIQKNDYILFLNSNKISNDDNLTHIEYTGVCRVKNNFSQEFIDYKDFDYNLEVTHIREIKENKKNTSNIVDFKSIAYERTVGIDIFNKKPNTILYGPPGTGKTYNTYNEAIKLFDNLWYIENCTNKEQDRIKINEGIKVLMENQHLRFCTFHQSYGYEEFIEGIKSDGNGNFKVEDGIFKEIAIDALYEGLKLEVKINLEIEKDNLSEEESRKRKKELVLENIHNKDNFEFKGAKNYILVIDEINRGNISKIFGELITLLEEDKRLTKENEVLVKLPYSKEFFCLPPNLYIIGTMNTSDKSIALMDTALRRRFSFKEMMPNHELLKEVDNIKLDVMLEKINKRIEFLYDRDYMIGHAYLINVKNLEDIVYVFKNKIIPLLQEYFYDDWEKIGLILGGIGKDEYDNCIVYKKEINPSDIFNDAYEINKYRTKTKYYIKEEISEKELRRIYE